MEGGLGQRGGPGRGESAVSAGGSKPEREEEEAGCAHGLHFSFLQRGVEIHGYQHHGERPHQDGKPKPRDAPRVAVDGVANMFKAALGEQVVQVAQAAAFFIDWDEVASPSTAQRGPGEHHLWGGGPEGRCEVHPVHGA